MRHATGLTRGHIITTFVFGCIFTSRLGIRKIKFYLPILWQKFWPTPRLRTVVDRCVEKWCKRREMKTRPTTTRRHWNKIHASVLINPRIFKSESHTNGMFNVDRSVLTDEKSAINFRDLLTRDFKIGPLKNIRKSKINDTSWLVMLFEW